MARSPHRIRPFLAMIEAVWLEHPDMRFGQLLANIAGREDTWHWEGSRWYAAAEAFRAEMEEADRG